MKSSTTVTTASATPADVDRTTAETATGAAVAIEVPGVTYEARFSNALAIATQSSPAIMRATNAEATQSSSVVDHEALDEWSDLFTPEAKESLRQCGLGHLLLPPVKLTYLRGIEEPRPNSFPVYATIEEIAAVEGLELRTLAITENEIHGTCPASRALIESVKEAGVPGWVLQMRLHPPTPYRKIWPWWYRPYKAPPRDLRAGNLFKAFGIDISGDNK